MTVISLHETNEQYCTYMLLERIYIIKVFVIVRVIGLLLENAYITCEQVLKACENQRTQSDYYLLLLNVVN